MTRPAHLDSAHLCSPTLTRRGRPRPARAPAPNSSTPDSPASQKKKKESALDQAGTLAARRTQPADHRPLWPAVLLPQRQRLPRNTAYLYPPPAPRRPPRKATARNAPLGPASQKKRHLPTGQPVKRGCPPHRPARRWRRTQKQSQPITEPHAAGGPSASPGARWLGKATAEGIRAGSGTQITDPARRAAPPRGCTALHCQTPIRTRFQRRTKDLYQKRLPGLRPEPMCTLHANQVLCLHRRGARRPPSGASRHPPAQCQTWQHLPAHRCQRSTGALMAPRPEAACAAAECERHASE